MTPYGRYEPGSSFSARRPYVSAARNSCWMSASDPSPSTAFASSIPKRSARRNAASERGRYEASAVSRQRSWYAKPSWTRSSGSRGRACTSASSRLTPAAPTPPAVPGERVLDERTGSSGAMPTLQSETRRARRRRGPRGRARPQPRRPRGVSFVVSRRASPAVLLVSRVVVALVRGRDVGEAREERVVGVRVHPVTDDVVRRAVRVPVAEPEALDDRPDDRPVSASDGADLDVRDVVLEPASVREARRTRRRAARAGSRCRPAAP